MAPGVANETSIDARPYRGADPFPRHYRGRNDNAHSHTPLPDERMLKLSIYATHA